MTAKGANWCSINEFFPSTCSSIFVLEQDVDWRTLHARGNRTADIECNNAGSKDHFRREWKGPIKLWDNCAKKAPRQEMWGSVHLFFVGMGGVSLEVTAATTRRRRNICALHTDNTRSVEHRLHKTCSWTSVFWSATNSGDKHCNLSNFYINLTFRMLVNIHFQKWSKVTGTDYDKTIYTK